MSISKDSLKGYILEEVLAYLIRNTGYELLVDPSQDSRELAWRGNGLVVKGRGSVHQVDVLGQLKWIPAFTFPIRLFVEAKFRGDTTGIEHVRNAVGVLADVNQNNSPTREDKVYYPKYQYVYALFSTSGFSKDAIKMALAHQVSLIDLSGSEFGTLKTAVENAASVISSNDLAINVGVTKSVRAVLREKLDTWPNGVPINDLSNDALATALAEVVRITEEYGELFVAMANGPFMLLLKAEDHAAFIEYAIEHPRHNVAISWSTRDDGGRTWVISPSGENADNERYALSFRLPRVLADYIFEVQAKAQERAWQTKNQFFSEITIYRYIDGKDCLFRLVYDAEATRRLVEESQRRRSSS